MKELLKEGITEFSHNPLKYVKEEFIRHKLHFEDYE